MAQRINGVVSRDRTVHYLATALWAETVSLPVSEDELVDGCMDVDDDHPLADLRECEPLDDYFEVDDFDAESLRKAESDCDEFFKRLEANGLLGPARKVADDGHIAYDFWLTRNGHGAGFWDGDYDGFEENLGDNMTELCKAFGEQHVCINDDGTLSLEG